MWTTEDGEQEANRAKNFEEGTLFLKKGGV
jgi:hypothetical protein